MGSLQHHTHFCNYYKPILDSNILKDTTTNHASVRILLNINLPKTDFIYPVKDYWRYMLLSLIPRWVNVKLCL